MVRKAGESPRLGAPVAAKVAALVVISLLAAVLAGCSLGPVNLGGDTAQGTPAPTNPPQPTPVPPSPTTAGRPLAGTVQDALTGKPIAAAEVTAGGALTETTSTGQYWFDDVPAGSKLKVSAQGYAATELDTGKTNQLAVKLRPNVLRGRVTDAKDGKPLAGVLVKLVLPQPAAPVTGTGSMTNTLEGTMVANPTAASTPVSGTGELKGFPGLAAPLPNVTGVFTGATPTDAPAASGDTPGMTNTPAATSTPLPPTPTPTPKPVPPTGDGFVAVYTDDSGNYTFKDVPQNATLTFKMPGYKLTKMPAGDAPQKDVALERFVVQAAYITANVAASKDLFDPLLAFIEKSKFNAVVLNVQDDSSAWVFDTQNPDALAAKNTDKFLKDMPQIVKSLKDKGIYTIARVVTFQQATMADARPDLAVMSSVTGKPWKGGYKGQQRWLDASNPKAQDYILAMTKEVLALGFDEVQYDYVRFPSDQAPNEPGDQVFSRPLNDSTKPVALEGFLKRAHGLIEPSDAFMSIDIFGYTIWPDQDGKPLNGLIGQVFENMVDNTDYVAPMIYPSHFSPGELGCAKPETCAYKIIVKAGEYAQQRFAGRKAKYRPWLQDFDWGTTDYTSPGTTKVAEQLQACAETGCWGWMIWDPLNEYQPRSVFKK